MAESTFDPESFLAGGTDEASETRYTPIPDGEYTAMVDDIAVREVSTVQGDSIVLDVSYAILDDNLKEKMDMEKPMVRQSIFLDLEADGRMMLGMNKNVKLGRLREALRQNNPGEPWNYGMLKGAGPVIVKVSQRPDKNDATVIYNNVDRVAALT